MNIADGWTFLSSVIKLDFMSFHPANLPTLLSFSLIVGFVILAFLAAVTYVEIQSTVPSRKRRILVSTGVFFWIAFFSLIGVSDLLKSHPFPGIPLFFMSMNIGALIFVFSRFGKEMARQLPIQALVGFQMFRFPLELVLHSWAEQGTIPTSMTWSGQNWDIISGVLALILFPLSKKSKLATWTANIVGLALLINVMRVAVMSSPLPFAWPVNPPLQLAFYFPYVLIGPVCVAGALVGHLLLTRKLILLSNRKQ